MDVVGYNSHHPHLAEHALANLVRMRIKYVFFGILVSTMQRVDWLCTNILC